MTDSKTNAPHIQIGETEDERSDVERERTQDNV